MKSFLYFLPLFMMCLGGCKQEPLPPFYNVAMPEQFQDNGPLNTEINQDNEVYKPSRRFTFQYTYQGKDGKDLLVGVDTESDQFGQGPIPWKLIEKGTEDRSDYPVQKIDLIVYETKTSMENFLSKQTIIRYKCYNEAGEVGFGELTGLKEDAAAVWLHPPRYLGFVILEFNPFPEILKPLGTDTTWTRTIYIPEEWGAKLGLEYDGTAPMDIDYRQAGRETLKTALGELDCYKVTAAGEGEPGKTLATFYFEENYGFVKMQYQNIDGSTLTLDLIKMEE